MAHRIGFCAGRATFTTTGPADWFAPCFALSDLLQPEEYARVKDYFARHSSMLPFSLLERFKPMLISGLIEEQGLGCASTDGMEMQIMKELRDKDTKKPIKGLETAAFQASQNGPRPFPVNSLRRPRL